jgi:serine/threonine protein kinase
MGVVYRARQLSLDRTVALKVIAPALTRDAMARHRFVREARVAASIDHPNVIPIFYAGEEDGIAYLAMRFVDGQDLRTLVRAGGPLEPAPAAQAVAQVAAALDAAHAAGLVHRDIKPANVLVTNGGHVYLTDFGLTRLARGETETTQPGHWAGTLDFAAPEQIRGDRLDARADVYSLGCLLHHALAGRAPFGHVDDQGKLSAELGARPGPDARRAARPVLGRAARAAPRPYRPGARPAAGGVRGRPPGRALGDGGSPGPARSFAASAGRPDSQRRGGSTRTSFPRLSICARAQARSICAYV